MTPIRNPHTAQATQVATASLIPVAEESVRCMKGEGTESGPLDEMNSARVVDGLVIFNSPIIGGLESVAPWCIT
jgi:hypothetical protein